MSQGHAFNKRDIAEPRYLKIYAKHGATWHPLPRGCGCDGLLLCNYSVEIVEHKTHEGDDLTDAERALQQKCILSGVAYNVIDSDLAALRLVQEMRGVHEVDLKELEPEHA